MNDPDLSEGQRLLGALAGILNATDHFIADNALRIWLRNNAPALLAEAARARTLEAALRELAEDYASMMAYVDDYFLKRWGYAARLELVRALLDTQEGP